MNLKLSRQLRALMVLLLSISLCNYAYGGEVKAAVAANFTAAINQMAPVFETKTGHKIVASFGATGLLFAQIQNGAPFDVLLAADDTHFTPLLPTKLAVNDTAFIYSIGRVVLWKGGTGAGVENASTQQLTAALKDLRADQPGSGKLAIANPKTAPYGAAAVSAMQKLGVYDALQNQFVTGENIAQTQQFVESGAAAAGFVALAQIKTLPIEKQGQWWLVPAELHAPISQQAMLLSSGENNAAAKAFLAFLKSDEAITIMHRLGYSTPGKSTP